MPYPNLPPSHATSGDTPNTMSKSSTMESFGPKLRVCAVFAPRTPGRHGEIQFRRVPRGPKGWRCPRVFEGVRSVRGLGHPGLPGWHLPPVARHGEMPLAPMFNSFCDPPSPSPLQKTVTTSDKTRTRYSSEFTAGLDGADGVGGSR